MAKVKLGLGNLNPQEVSELANTIVTMMTGNANFPTPNPPLASVTSARTTANTSIAAYDTGKATAETLRVTRDDDVGTLKGLLTQLAAYVENASNGDAAKIESAGMSVRADSTVPVGPMPQVMDLVLTAGDFDGTLDAMWHPVRGVTSYELQTSPDPPSSWTAKMASGKSSATIEGLTSATKLWVRVRAMGADNKPGPWSDPATKVVP